MVLRLLILILISSCSMSLRDSQYRGPTSATGDKVGIEATLTNEFLQNNIRLMPPELDQYILDLVAQIRIICTECKINTYTGPSYEEEYKVTFPDGFHFNIGRDQRVIEVTASPISSKDLVTHSQKISNTLLLAGERIGLRPAKHTGGGHLHFDFTGLFQEDRQLFRDFMVDYYNHQFIFSEFFGGEINNAPVIGDLPASSQENFQKIIDDFDKSPFSIYEFIERLNSEVYHQTFNPNYNPSQKYQALSLIHAYKELGTLEFRSVRPYQSGESVNLIANMIFKRRDHLKSLRTQGIAINLGKKTNHSIDERFELVSKYLMDSGLSARDYYRFFPKEQLTNILKNLSTGDLFNFLKEYISHTPFDSYSRVQDIFSKDIFRKLNMDQRRDIVKAMVKKLYQHSSYGDFKRDLSGLKRFMIFDLFEIEREVSREILGSESCSRLIKTLLP
ncbi:MAG: hypothetical protein K9K67_14025 [Bacteriovoracaceae bacterium]|nr:hypothetical protein [Bacteriovoracaceae bacterium]